LRTLLAGIIMIAALTVTSPLKADTINFEGLPDSTVVTTQYSGLTFANAIILSSGISLNEYEFPPHSGVNVVSDNNGPISITFAAPITSFGAFFTYAEPLTLDAFNGSDSLVTSAGSAFFSNDALYGDPGSSANEFVGLSYASGITEVSIIGDPLGGSFTMDDMSYASSTAVPEPSACVLLLWGVALLLCLRFRKETRTNLNLI
jgi:hypothetical protein